MRQAPRGTDRPFLEALPGARGSVALTAGWRRAPTEPALAACESHVWAFEARTAAGREILKREILARYTGLDPGTLAIDRLPSGKPVLATTGRCAGLRFNSSACGALCLLALRRDVDVGIDVEAIQALPDDIARRAMTASERVAYEREPVARRAEYFLTLWTAKEAATKVRGHGLRQAFDAFEAGETTRLPHDGGVETLWIRRIPPPRPDHAAAVASTAPFGDLSLWSLLEPPEA